MNSGTTRARTYEAEQVIRPIYTGGDVGLNSAGTILASTLGEDVMLTDLGSGVSVGRIEGDGQDLTALVLTPSASHVITCSRSLVMRIYSLEPAEKSKSLTATLHKTLKPHTTPVVSATVDSTGSILATGGADGTVKVWDIRGGYVSHTFRGHSGLISSLKFFQAAPELVSTQKKKRKSQDVEEYDENTQTHESTTYFLAAGGEDGRIRIWDLVKRKAIANLDSHVSVVRGLDFSSSANALLSSSRDRTVIIWDAGTWKPRRTIPILEAVECTGFLLNAQCIFTAGESGRLRLWDPNTSREITDQKATTNGNGILQVIKQPDLPYLLSVHSDQTILLHSIQDLSALGKGVQLESLPVVRRISGTHDEIIDMAFLSHDNLLALATNSESVRLISVPASNHDSIAGSQETTEYFGADIGLLEGHEDIIICLDVDWSGCWLATGAKDNTARLWCIDRSKDKFECFATFQGHAESIGAVSLPKVVPPEDTSAFKDPTAHPPKFLITGSQDKTVKRWNIESQPIAKNSNRALFTRKAHDKDINSIDINSAGTFFASASQDKTVKIWSVEEGETQGILRGHKRGVWSVKFSPKDVIITGESGPAKAGRGFILTGSGDKTLKIWSLSDYSCLRTLEGHTNSILKVIWLPLSLSQESKNKAASLVVSAGGDGLVKVWDANSGECAATLDNHEDRVWALTTNSSRENLVSGGGDGVITFWVDTTASTEAAVTAASTERIEQEQLLLNHQHNGNYREAIVLALQLDHPARLLSFFTNVVKHNEEEGSLSGLKGVDDVLQSLSDDQLYTLLLRLRDWNTNARNAPIAQRILWVIFKSYPASRLISLRKRGRGLGEVIDGLKAYTERHYRRIEELLEESYVVDFVVRGMEEGGFVDEMGAAIEQDPKVNGHLESSDMVLVE